MCPVGEVPRSIVSRCAFRKGAFVLRKRCRNDQAESVGRSIGALGNLEFQQDRDRCRDYRAPAGGDQVRVGAFPRPAPVYLHRRTAGVCRVPVASNGTHTDAHRQSAREIRRSAIRALVGMGAGAATLLDSTTSVNLRADLARLRRRLRRRDRAFTGPESETGPVALFFLIFEKRGADSRA